MTENIIKPNYKAGIWISLIGGLYLVIMYPIALIKEYWPLIAIESAKGPEGCEANVIYYYPAYTDLGIIAGVLLIAASYGFYKRNNWATGLAVSGSVLALKGSFWPMVPPMSNSLFPFYMYVFVPALLIYFTLTKIALRFSIAKISIGVLGGMAAITSFMNAIAATNRILAVGSPDNTIYVMAQRLNMIAGLTLVVVTIAILVVPHKEWVKVTALVAVLVELAVGIPVATSYSFEIGRISFFYMGPVFSLLLLIAILTPKIWDKINE